MALSELILLCCAIITIIISRTFLFLQTKTLSSLSNNSSFSSTAHGNYHSTFCLEKWNIACHIRNQRWHSHQQLHPLQMVSWWALRELRKERIPAIQQPSDCSHSLRWAPRELGMWKHRILEPDSWGTSERSDFSEPRLLYRHIHREMLNSLIWDT